MLWQLKTTSENKDTIAHSESLSKIQHLECS
jgi:hypothetical protein